MSSAAKPGPPREPARAPDPPPPPWWRVWLLVVGIVLTALLFLTPSVNLNNRPTHNFAYSDFIAQVTDNQVKTATISQSGHVSGVLANGDNYTTQLPDAPIIRDDQLLPLLQQHHVTVKGAPPDGITLLSFILNLLPFALF